MKIILLNINTKKFFLSAVLILVSLLELTDLEIGKVFVKIKCLKKEFLCNGNILE